MKTDLDLFRRLVCIPEAHDHPDAVDELACQATILGLIRAGQADHLLDRLPRILGRRGA